MRYALSDYILAVTFKDTAMTRDFKSLSIGGDASYLDSVEFDYTNDRWSTKGYATGGWSHDKNLSRIGTVNLSIHQLSDAAAKLRRIAKRYDSADDVNGMVLALSDRNGNVVASADDCYIQKVPTQTYGSESTNQTWTFTCGCITIE